MAHLPFRRRIVLGEERLQTTGPRCWGSGCPQFILHGDIPGWFGYVESMILVEAAGCVVGEVRPLCVAKLAGPSTGTVFGEEVSAAKGNKTGLPWS